MEDTIDFKNRERLYDAIAKELNFVKIKEQYFSEAFGNFVVVFSVNELLIRYSSDRSELTIQIASIFAPSKWCDLSFVKNFMYNLSSINSQNEYGGFGINRIIKLNNFLQDNFGAISELFNKQNYQQTQNQIKEQVQQANKDRFPGSVVE